MAMQCIHVLKFGAGSTDIYFASHDYASGLDCFTLKTNPQSLRDEFNRKKVRLELTKKQGYYYTYRLIPYKQKNN